MVPKGHRNSTPLSYECGPNGEVDSCALDGRTITLGGWVADAGLAARNAVDHRVPHRVAIAFSDGASVDADLGQVHRPDIAARLHRTDDPTFEYSGWQARGRLQRSARANDILTVTAVCEHGCRCVLDATRLDDVLGRTRRHASTEVCRSRSSVVSKPRERYTTRTAFEGWSRSPPPSPATSPDASPTRSGGREREPG